MRSFAAFLLPALAVASPLVPGIIAPGAPGWADGPDPSQIQIVKTGFSGNGCPQGSVSTNISPDRTVSREKHDPKSGILTKLVPSQVVTFGFDKFQTFIGPGYSPLDRTKNCQLHLTLKVCFGISSVVLIQMLT